MSEINKAFDSAAKEQLATEIKEADLYAGRRLRRRRRLLGLTQQDLAEKAGVQFQQIQKYESGKNRINAGRLGKLAEILAVTPDYFFDIKKPKAAKTLMDVPEPLVPVMRAVQDLAQDDQRMIAARIAEMIGKLPTPAPKNEP